jgi:site-specific recombinase XerD
MDGVYIREVQEFSGHKSIETTIIYTHILKEMINIPVSSLDNIYSIKNHGNL